MKNVLLELVLASLKLATKLYQRTTFLMHVILKPMPIKIWGYIIKAIV